MPSSDSSARSLVRGASLMVPATILGSAAILLVDVYANHALTLADYGLYGSVRRLVQILGFVVLIGMENAVIRVVARRPDEPSARAGVRTALFSTGAVSLVFAAAIWLLAPTVASWVDPSPDTVSVLRLGALALPLWAIRTIAVSACQGWGSLTPRALVTFVVWPVVQLAGLAVGATWLGLGAVGAVAGFVVAVALGAAQAMWHLLRLRADAFREEKEAGEGAFAPMFAVAWPGWAQGVGMALYTWFDQTLVTLLAGFVAAGLYGPVSTLTPIFGMGLGALNNAFAPVIAKKHASGDTSGLESMYRIVTRWALVLAVPPVALALAVPMCVLVPWRSATEETALALRIAAATQILCTGVGSVNYLLLMSGRQRDTLYNAVPAVLLNLGVSVALIPEWGIAGAALGNAAGMLVANFVGLWQVKKHLGIHPFHVGLARPLGAGLVVVAVALAAQSLWGPGWLALIVGIGVGGVLFLATLAGLGLDEGDRLVVDALKRKAGRR